MKFRLLVAVASLAGLLWFAVGWSKGSAGATDFETRAIVRGDLTVAISATGTLEPEEVIDVGAQVAGQILEFGRDSADKPIDFGSQVEQGTILAKIDESLYAAEVAQREAELARAQADLSASEAKLYQAKRDWERAQKIGPSEALSPSAYDGYRSAFENASAQILVSKAAIAQAQAGLDSARRNLGYTIIRSPVKGVIIDRRVNIGQTVVSSLNAPSLFLIAKDLRRMQIWAAVNEADVGQVRPGQRVTYSVDAFPNESFEGTVNKIRLNASMTQNVVTYIVEVTTDNSSGRLLPYLTANVRFLIDNRRDVLLVPNAALRFSPTAEERRGGTAAGDARGTPLLWVAEDGGLRPLRVNTGLSDGVATEITGDGVQEGLPVVIGRAVKESGQAAQGSNPFTPQMRGRPRGP